MIIKPTAVPRALGAGSARAAEGTVLSQARRERKEAGKARWREAQGPQAGMAIGQRNPCSPRPTLALGHQRGQWLQEAPYVGQNDPPPPHGDTYQVLAQTVRAVADNHA